MDAFYGAMQYYISPAISPLPRAVRRRNDLGSEGVYSGLAIWASDLEERERGGHQALGKGACESEKHRRVCELTTNEALAATVQPLFMHLLKKIK